MGTLTQRVDDYFASLSPLASRIIQERDLVKKKHGEEWSSLTVEQQEEILDNHFIDPDIKSNYPQKEDAPECFPKLKINCGENIVADFEDGAMWRDEHSGPFSWYSLSQQDLSIPDPVEVAEEGEENAADVSPKKGGKGKKKKKKTKKGKASTATDDEVGSEEGNIDQQTVSETNKSEVLLKPDDSLNQSGSLNCSISLSPSKMSSSKNQVKAEEETKLLDSSFESGAPKAAPPPPPVDKRWKKQDKQNERIENKLMSELTADKPSLKLLQDAEGGMVSGVFVHEVGESSTDPNPAIAAPPKSPLHDLGAIGGQEVSATSAAEFGAVGGQVNLALDEEESIGTANTEKPSDAPEKPGFDFLLDW